jgi:hypothetical protein
MRISPKLMIRLTTIVLVNEKYTQKYMQKSRHLANQKIHGPQSG